MSQTSQSGQTSPINLRNRGRVLAIAVVAALITGTGVAAGQAPLPPTGGPPAELPAGHPPVPGRGKPAPDVSGARQPGFAPAPDMSRSDPTIPAGTVRVRVAAPDGAPLASQLVTLIQRLETPTQKAEERFSALTDAEGVARFSGLETSTDYQFVVFTGEGPAQYATQAFRLDPRAGHDVLLHVYPVTTRMPPQVVSSGWLSIQPSADTFHVSARYEFLNMQPLAWAPTNVVIPLPKGGHAINTQSGQGGLRLERRDGAVELTGTAAPGSHVVFYSFQIPNPNAATFEFEMPVAPHLVAMTVEAEAIEGLDLSVAGYDPAVPGKFGDINTLSTRLVRIPDAAALRTGAIEWISTVEVTLDGLPSRGAGRLIAAALAALIAFGGAALALGAPSKRDNPEAGDVEQARRVLLSELVEVERAQRDGRIGPTTYRRARAMLLDAMARL